MQKNAIEETISELESDSEKVDFETFCKIAAKHMLEEDEEGLRDELKEAFRIYDKEGNGYITTDVLKEILREIDQVKLAVQDHMFRAILSFFLAFLLPSEASRVQAFCFDGDYTTDCYPKIFFIL